MPVDPPDESRRPDPPTDSLDDPATPAAAWARVVLAADLDADGRTLANLLRASDRIDLVGEAPDGDTALELVVRHRPHVAVVDLYTPKLNPERFLRAVIQAGIQTGVVFSASVTRGGAMVDALLRGGAVFLTRRGGDRGLVEAIIARVQGRAEVTQRPFAPADAARGGDAGIQLSDRELDVLELTSRGRTVKEIAWELNLSATTVNTMLMRARTKLGASDKAHAVALAIRRGLL